MTLQELQAHALRLSVDDRAALAQILLNSLQQESTATQEHPLAKFAGILSDAKANELQQVIQAERSIVNSQ